MAKSKKPASNSKAWVGLNKFLAKFPVRGKKAQKLNKMNPRELRAHEHPKEPERNKK